MKLALIALLFASTAYAAEPCQLIHGIARTYSGDGQIRIWHIGTHHTFDPAGDSWKMLENKLGWTDDNEMVADFTLCPTEPYVRGATQGATIEKMEHVHIQKRPR